jgi:hypothetical protein
MRYQGLTGVDLTIAKLPLHWGVLAVISASASGLFWLPFLAPSLSIAPWGDTIYLTGPLFREISRGVEPDVLPLMHWSVLEAVQ